VFQEHRFNNGAVTLNVAEGPRSGRPLVLLHGGSSRWQSYRWLLEPIAHRWHVYAPDLRGHGGSSWTPGRYRLWDYADDVIALLEQVVQGPGAIAGHSLGGEVAIIIAAQRPDLIRAVVPIDAPLSAEETFRTVGPDRDRLAWIRSLHALPDDQVAAALRDLPIVDRASGRTVRARDLFGDSPDLDGAETLMKNDPAMLDAVIEFDEMHAGYDAEWLLPRIECPVLLLLADADRGSAVSPEHSERALQLLRYGQVVRISGTSHGLVWEEPNRVRAAIETFLADTIGSRH
jgi:pimeloyl-ACP methyl ester carboxylesterase